MAHTSNVNRKRNMNEVKSVVCVFVHEGASLGIDTQSTV